MGLFNVLQDIPLAKVKVEEAKRELVRKALFVSVPICFTLTYKILVHIYRTQYFVCVTYTSYTLRISI